MNLSALKDRAKAFFGQQQSAPAAAGTPDSTDGGVTTDAARDQAGGQQDADADPPSESRADPSNEPTSADGSPVTRESGEQPDPEPPGTSN